MKIRLVGVDFSMRTDGKRDRQDKGNSRFSQFFESTNNLTDAKIVIIIRHF
jgi:hypothetical protein